MSEVKLKPTGGGAGSISLKAPAATTGNGDFPLILPADDGSADQYLKTNGSGTLSWAGSGKILQVKSTTKTDTTSVDTAASFADISGMSVTLTTPGSGTKALVRFDLQISGTDNFYGAVRLLRGSTDICQGDAITGYTRATSMLTDIALSSGHGPYKLWSVTNEFLDTHGADGSTDVTYKLQWRETRSSDTIWLNKTVAGDLGDSNIAVASTITAMEVAA